MATHRQAFVLYQRHNHADVVQGATSFVAACYGETKSTYYCCASEAVERFNCQSEYCFRSKAVVTPQQINHFGSMQSDTNVKLAFGALRC